MPEPLTVDVFLDRLDIGEYDDRLDEIRKRAEERVKELTERKARTFQPGQILRIKEGVTPKYLAGKTCTFVRHDPKQSKKKGRPWVRVALPKDPEYQKYSGGEDCKADAQYLEPLTKGNHDR